jgi:exonuclease SbcD
VVVRILHTSDWHLGRVFGGHSLLADQERVIDRLVEIVRSERVQVVAVAGDIYDRAVPPAEAVALFRTALVRLRGAGAAVVAIAGNHDSPDRLAAYDGLTDLAGVHVRGGYRRAAQVVEVEAGGETLAVVPVPFLDPVLVPVGATPRERVGGETVVGGTVKGETGETVEGDTGETVEGRPTHTSVLVSHLERVRPLVAGRASLVVAHAFVAGGVGSESERDVTVGGADIVPTGVFAGFSYVALGHLHTPQRMGSRVRYSGSPLAYSFSETAPKQVVLVDIPRQGRPAVHDVAVEVGRPVATITGRIADLLTDRAHERVRAHWVRARLTDPGYVLDAKRRLAERFPYVVQVELDPSSTADPSSAEPRFGPRRSPVQLAAEFWAATQGAPPDRDEQELLAQAIAHASAQETAA